MPGLASSSRQELFTLINTVVEGGYCIGCGVCAALPHSPLTMQLDDYGRYQATLPPQGTLSPQEEYQSEQTVPYLSTCPFAEGSANEDELARDAFGDRCTYHDQIGYYLETYAGYVAEGDFRGQGSSGGMGTWILAELFRQNQIDYVVHVQQQSEPGDPLFKFQVSSNLDEIRHGAKSRYYPVELSEVLQQIREQPGRYAIVGVPCFIKAIRLLAKVDPVICDRITFCIGLVCGHLKSTRFADMFAWQCGIPPGQLQSINFRKKLPGRNANRYGVEVVGMSNGQQVTVTKPNNEFFGFLWGHGFFKYQACDFCDDVLAETADMTVGDAWLPQYVEDSQGTNVLVVRHPLLHQLLQKGQETGRLQLDLITAQQVAQSQDAGLRHRREGLAYRLHLKDQAREWRPQKRLQPSKMRLRPKFRKVHQVRMALAKASHRAFALAIKNRDFNLFKQAMEPKIKEYNSARKPYLWQRLWKKSTIITSK
ncbi:Coenzyme F420 hydrogenase/dehydrogenase, beta subunit C-terminal domain [Acaryochloris sp. IP29b_bin.137]|uniref:Coenzyme F420 hydrogenase/dehydrogenase, beta subunit C-terminal domain n=1 Tax=Acaryochloris sp. IP29b_bin.137 TaxID=2969217 RepID=UPI00262379D4|nr:Coenzyme F420 hydrogenase/dehydrogenase, beta subunit C-terminal domain [Acaryochloris sp. IP29b_bin.137]